MYKPHSGTWPLRLHSGHLAVLFLVVRVVKLWTLTLAIKRNDLRGTMGTASVKPVHLLVCTSHSLVL